MRSILLTCATGLAFVCAGVTGAAERFRTPAASDPERAALLRVAHDDVRRALGQPVRFVVGRLRVGDSWAFMSARMGRADGGAIDYARTRYAEAARHGGVSQDYAAVMRRVGGVWRIEAEAIGPTDPAWLAWPEQVGAPPELFSD